MTLIMATVVDGMSYIASDRLGSDGLTKGLYKNHKVFLKENILIGGCGSFKPLQLIEHVFDVPVKSDSDSIDVYMHKVFVPALTVFLRDEHILTSVYNYEFNDSSELIFVVGGRLFKMQGDLSLLEPEDNVLCTGSGEDHALAVLKALRGFDLSVEEMFKRALRVTSECVTSVGGRLHLVKCPVT